MLVFMAVMSFSQNSIAGLVSGTGYGLAAPGGAATIYGTFPGVPTTVAPATLPKTLGGIQVLVNGLAAPLYYVSSTQINLQIPWETNTSSPNALITVGNNSALFPIASTAASIFETNTVTQQGAILDVNYKLVDYTNPVTLGQVIQIYCTGLGPVTVTQTDGVPASATQLAYTVDIPTVTIAGEPAKVLFSGLSPDFVGLYQINAVVPPNAIPAAVALAAISKITFVQISINGVTYNAVEMGYAPIK